MSFVTLVRHGQANTQARDEESYDRLSDLGHQQATWLGAYFSDVGDVFARVYCGTLRRHVETLDAISPACGAAAQRDPRLNEIAYFTMAQRMEAQHGIAMPTCREDFAVHLPMLFDLWQKDRLDDVPERFAVFEARVKAVMAEIAGGTGRALVVTSGGFIGMAIRQALGLDTRRLSLCCLAIENSSVHRFQTLGGSLAVTQFNALPHLDTPSRQHARSHV